MQVCSEVQYRGVPVKVFSLISLKFTSLTEVSCHHNES